MMFVLYLLIVLIGIFLDQYTKYLIANNFLLAQSKTIIADFFNITYVRNFGAGFSIFQNKRLFLVLVSCVAFVIIFYLLIKDKNKVNKLAYIFILTGTIGNLIDRCRLGYVVDFLDFTFFGYGFPVFNIADCFITIGCFTIIIYSLLEK